MGEIEFGRRIEDWLNFKSSSIPEVPDGVQAKFSESFASSFWSALYGDQEWVPLMMAFVELKSTNHLIYKKEAFPPLIPTLENVIDHAKLSLSGAPPIIK